MIWKILQHTQLRHSHKVFWFCPAGRDGTVCQKSRPGFWACPVVSLSWDNEETFVPLSRKVELSRPDGNPSFKEGFFFGQSTWAKEFLNFMLGFKSAILAIFQSWCKQFFWQETSFETWYLLKISLTCPTSQGPPNPGFRSVDINSLTWSTLLLLD